MSSYNSIRIVHVIGSGNIYGAERWILALLRYLDHGKIDSTLVNLIDTQKRASAIVQEAKSRNINAVDFYTGGRYNPIGVTRFCSWIKRNNIDIIHSHGYKSDIYSLLAARITKKKVISTPHGWSKEGQDWKLKFYERLDQWCLPYMDRVCPLSPELWKNLDQWGVNKEKNIYISNGVDLHELDQFIVTNDKKSNETLIIGYVGQLIERKNLPFLFQAFQSMNNKRRNLHLWIVGDGPLRQDLLERAGDMGIADRMRFTGYSEEALAVMKQFDAFVLPSQLEGIPRCVMEAMALGIPVVASDIPGNRELVEHGRTGLLFPLDDSRRLAEAILYILENPEHARKMCQNARERIEKEFSARKMANDYLHLYEAVFCESNP